MMNRIQINNITYSSISGKVDIVGGRVIIDGVVQEQSLKGVVEVRILEGAINNLTTDASVHCESVQGDVKAGGSVNCGSVAGDVKAGGSVNCGSVAGDVKAGGSVNMRR